MVWFESTHRTVGSPCCHVWLVLVYYACFQFVLHNVHATMRVHVLRDVHATMYVLCRHLALSAGRHGQLLRDVLDVVLRLIHKFKKGHLKATVCLLLPKINFTTKIISEETGVGEVV